MNLILTGKFFYKEIQSEIVRYKTKWTDIKIDLGVYEDRKGSVVGYLLAATGG